MRSIMSSVPEVAESANGSRTAVAEQEISPAPHLKAEVGFVSRFPLTRGIGLHGVISVGSFPVQDG